MISAPCWTKLELGRPKEEKVKLVEGRVGMAANDNRTVVQSVITMRFSLGSPGS